MSKQKKNVIFESGASTLDKMCLSLLGDALIPSISLLTYAVRDWRDRGF